MKHHRAVLPMALAGCISMLASSNVPAAELPDHGLARQATVYGDYSGMPTQADPEFGFSVSMDEGWLAVGAPGVVFNDSTHGSNEHGAVFLFQYVDHAWQLDHVIVDAAWGDSRCGESVSLDYPHLIVGCPGADEIDNPSTEAGIVRWYSHKVQLPPNTGFVWSIDSGYHGAPGGRCGTAVVINAPYSASSQPTLAVGCPGNAGDQGAVVVYDRNPTTFDWAIDDVLAASDGAVGDQFGSSLSLFRSASGTFGTELLAVGAPTTGVGSTFGVGATYVFSGTLAWAENDKVTGFGQGNYSVTLFGQSVAINDETLLVGEPGGFTTDCPNAPRCGAFDMFEPSGTDWNYSGGQYAFGENPGGNPPGAQVGMSYGASVAMGFDNMIAVGAPDTDGFTGTGGLAEKVGLVELYRLPGLTPLGGFLPAIGDLGLAEGHFGTSVDFGQQFLAVGYPDSGNITGRTGSVRIYGPDRIFCSGFEAGDNGPCHYDHFDADFASNEVLAIPEDGYDGSQASMACTVIDTGATIPAVATVDSVTFQTKITHTWVGDLTVKLVSPDGSVLGVFSRPGFDDTDDNGTGASGDSSDVSATSPLAFADAAANDAESMGDSLTGPEVVCQDDGICSYFPNPGSVATPPANFAGFVGEAASGTWKLCVGDSNPADIGSLEGWSLSIGYSVP